MSHISKILIENYQKHSKTILNLSKGLNVFWGESDQGKSSIIRSIKWAICNKPLGDEFRKHNTNRTSVSVRKGNNIVRRRKSQKINDYIVNSEKPYKAIRSSVPEDVSSALNLSETNIQSQHEVYFLVHKSPGQRSKILNEVAGLEIMDKTISLTNSEIRDVNAKLKWKKEAIADADAEIKGLSWTIKADKELSEIEKLENEIIVIGRKATFIQVVTEEIKKLTQLQNEMFPKSFTRDLGKLLDHQKETNLLAKKISRTASIFVKLHEQLKKKDKIQIIDITELEKRYISIEKLQNKVEVIESITEEMIEYELDHMSMYERILDTEHKIKDELKKLGICPTCKRKISKGEQNGTK